MGGCRGEAVAALVVVGHTGVAVVLIVFVLYT